MFAAFIGRSPDTATAEDLRRFQLHQTQAGMQPPSVNSAVSALRFWHCHRNFNGESTTEDADVQGSFDGKLVVRKRLLVRATGRVSGNISYGEIEIERGGKISGEISHDGESARLKQAQVA
jgi:hypothetical protein